MVRKAIANNRFYPDDKEKLEELIKSFSPEEGSKISAKGVVLPHAGYVYSGKTAVAAAAKVLPRKRVVILGNNHTGEGPNFSLYRRGSWQTPLGDIDIDEELTNLILSNGDCLKDDASAHRFEHSIEVELPILKYFFFDFKFIAIACKTSSLENYRKVANQIAEAIKGYEQDILFVASTDLTHYEPEETARTKDRRVIEAIVNLDEEALVKRVNSENITMCGTAPTAILISCLKKAGARKAHVELYQTSAEASGDCASVVGYVSIIIK